jgi:hypothetical protein
VIHSIGWFGYVWVKLTFGLLHGVLNHMGSGWLPLGSSIGTPGQIRQIFAPISSIFYGTNLPCLVPKNI